MQKKGHEQNKDHDKSNLIHILQINSSTKSPTNTNVGSV